MYNGDYFTYFLIVKDIQDDEIRGALSMHLEEETTNSKKKLYFDLANDVKFIPGDSIFKMFCKEYINELQKNRSNEALVAKLSVKYQVPSNFTAFIGKNEDSEIMRI